MGDKVKMDIITEGFKKLTCLRVSTAFLDARDYLNDPWLLIIHILGSVFIHSKIELYSFILILFYIDYVKIVWN